MHTPSPLRRGYSGTPQPTRPAPSRGPDEWHAPASRHPILRHALGGLTLDECRAPTGEKEIVAMPPGVRP